MNPELASAEALDSMQAMQTRVADTSQSDDIKVELQMTDLWQRFHELGTEMIITKAGRWGSNSRYLHKELNPGDINAAKSDEDFSAALGEARMLMEAVAV